jgi:regulator of nonsense transcripts 2
VWKVKFHRISDFAQLLSGLAVFQPTLATIVVDAVLEEIQIGMEINNPVHNQRRKCTIKYGSQLFFCYSRARVCV